MKKRIFLLLLTLSLLLPVFSGCGMSLTKTPYDIAVENGFVGSEEEWLASLKGDSAYDIWLSQGNTGTVEDFLHSLHLTVNQNNITVNSSATVEAANAKALLSVCSINATFQKTAIVRNGQQWETVIQNYRSAGAGVIYQLDKLSGSAYIITNFHVIFDNENEATSSGVSNNINLFLYGKEYQQYAIPATYVGGSVYFDIAVLKVENSDILRESDALAITPLPQDREVTVGQTAIAVGNPEGLGLSATRGVISVDSENIPVTSADGANVNMRVMRIDTAINSGNSGGGLFDQEGQLLGITNAKIVATGTENIGYAIPANVAIRVADNIIYNCDGKPGNTMKRAMIGLTVRTLSSSAHYNTETGTITVLETVTVTNINRGSLVEGKMQLGDILTAVTVEDQTYQVTRSYMFSDALLAAKVGDTVTLHIIRDGVAQTVTVVIDQNSLYTY